MERPDSCGRKTDILTRKSCTPSDQVSTQNRRHASQIDINPSRPLTYRFININIRTKIHGTLIVRACVRATDMVRVFENKVVRQIFGPERRLETTAQCGAS